MLGLSFLLLLAAFAALSLRTDPVGSLSPEAFAGLLAGAALALVAARRMVEGFRLGLAAGFGSVALWLVLCAGLWAAYANRDSLEEGAVRLAAELAAGRPVAAVGAEAVILRRMDGTFLVQGRANDREARFVFDTGASAVVLTAETARLLGIEPQPADYRVPISTANGRGFAAPVVLDSLAVGGIAERRVSAYVARPGALRENLLGMTFLERLASYEVRGGRLILRGKGT